MTKDYRTSRAPAIIFLGKSPIATFRNCLCWIYHICGAHAIRNTDGNEEIRFLRDNCASQQITNRSICFESLAGKGNFLNANRTMQLEERDFLCTLRACNWFCLVFFSSSTYESDACPVSLYIQFHSSLRLLLPLTHSENSKNNEDDAVMIIWAQRRPTNSSRTEKLHFCFVALDKNRPQFTKLWKNNRWLFLL